jgi:hypothetical protein
MEANMAQEQTDTNLRSTDVRLIACWYDLTVSINGDLKTSTETFFRRKAVWRKNLEQKSF